MRRLALVAALAGAFVLIAGGPAGAHPLGNFTVNWFSGLEVRPGAVIVHHVTDMAEIPAFQEVRDRIDTDGSGAGSETELAAYAEESGPQIARELTLTADGEPVGLTLRDAHAELLPGAGGLQILRVELTLEGLLPDGAADLTYTDANPGARAGWKEIVAYGACGARVVASSVPAESVTGELRAYPRDPLSSALDVTEARLTVDRSSPAAACAGSALPAAAAGTTDEGGFAGLVARSEISLPFALLAMLLAAGFGALHALGPGHGKTVMAAYLVGARAGVRQAVFGGVAVAGMHTVAVLALGGLILAASSLFPEEAVYRWLALVSGLVVTGLGAWLLRSRFSRRGRRTAADDHAREGNHGHVHHAPLSRKGLAALAVAGGLLPSPTAVVVLTGAVALDRVTFGLALVAAFSAGLAAALTAVGAIALGAHDFAARRLQGRLAAVLPVISAGAIVAVGTFLTARAALAF